MKAILLLVTLLISFNLFADAEFKMTRSSGKILINGEKYSKNLPLQVGDTVEAIGKKSFAQVKSTLGSVFLVRDGKIKLEVANEKESIISLIKGQFFHYLDPEKSKKRTFSVKTKNAIMGVRGTKYMISSDDKKDYLCVCEGVVAAQKNGETKEYLVEVGQDLNIYAGKSSSSKRKATRDMMRMTTDEFKAMGYPVYK